MKKKKISKFMLGHDKIKNNFPGWLAFCIAFSVLFASACEPAPSMRVNNNPTPAPSSENIEKLTGVPGEIRSMEDAGFQIIFVLRRKDGGIFEREDKRYIADNIPPETNRRVLTENDKAFVLGSNYEFTKENLEMLRKRFNVEDFSKPIAQVSVSANANINANVNSGANATIAPETPEGKRRR